MNNNPDTDVVDSPDEYVADRSGTPAASANFLEDGAEQSQDTKAEQSGRSPADGEDVPLTNRYKHFQRKFDKAQGEIAERDNRIAELERNASRVANLDERSLAIAHKAKELMETNPDEYERLVGTIDPSQTQDGKALLNVMDTRIQQGTTDLRNELLFMKAKELANAAYEADLGELKTKGFDYRDENNASISKFLRSLVRGREYKTMSEAYDSEKPTISRLLQQRNIREKDTDQTSMNQRATTIRGSGHLPSGNPARANTIQAARQSAIAAGMRAAALQED